MNEREKKLKNLARNTLGCTKKPVPDRYVLPPKHCTNRCNFSQCFFGMLYFWHENLFQETKQEDFLRELEGS